MKSTKYKFFCTPPLKKHERSSSVSCLCYDSTHNKIPSTTGIITIMLLPHNTWVVSGNVNKAITNTYHKEYNHSG